MKMADSEIGRIVREARTALVTDFGKRFLADQYARAAEGMTGCEAEMALRVAKALRAA